MAAMATPAGGWSQDPEDYKKIRKEDFSVTTDVEDIYRNWDRLISEEEWPGVQYAVKELARRKVQDLKMFHKVCVDIRRKLKHQFRKSQLLHGLQTLDDAGEIVPELMTAEERDALKRLLIKKGQKSTSGVLVVTVLTSPYPRVNGRPQRFSCQWNCYYCPNEPDQPRSYLHDEPSVLRANRNGFDPVLQFCDRAVTLAMNGHPVDKIELLVLGGTWASYPVEYQEDFIRDLFYAANTFYTRSNKRERLALAEEKARNERARCKIIGITLETRPDCIDADELRRFRRYGCTRVQLGVQHTDDGILERINRGCTTADTKRALRLLKDSCYKVDIHLMPNLPGANPELDRQMFETVLADEDLQADQWKIYPCEVTPWTVIQKWYQSGMYVPYKDPELFELLMDVKSRVHPWIRLNRVIRDIPSQYILGGLDNPSMRQALQRQMAERGLKCRCIRCREVRDRSPDKVVLVCREYVGQGAKEYFISFESPDRETILGFCRLRINKLVGRPIPQARPQHSTPPEPQFASPASQSRGREADSSNSTRRGRSKTPVRRRVRPLPCARSNSGGGGESDDDDGFDGQTEDELLTPFPELRGAALVRELHVYGQLIPTVDAKGSHAQHVGLGTQMMREAERIAQSHGATKIAVISGVGVRNFYRKLGYDLEGESEMLIKYLEAPTAQKTRQSVIILGLVGLLAALAFAAYSL